MPDIPIPHRIIALMQERNRLFAYPLEDIEAAIRKTGFHCSRCAACCKRQVNSHVFLLDCDVEVAREVDPSCIEPAPGPEFCDQDGTLYVSGYALKRRPDDPVSCWFLDKNLCRIYDRRFSVCRIYPHMLRPVRDAKGRMTWQQFAREGKHGDYRKPVSPDECHALAREIREYENAFLNQQIAFLEAVHEYFCIHGLHHDQEMYARQLDGLEHGEPADVMVYHAGALERNRCAYAGSPAGSGPSRSS